MQYCTETVATAASLIIFLGQKKVAKCMLSYIASQTLIDRSFCRHEDRKMRRHIVDTLSTHSRHIEDTQLTLIGQFLLGESEQKCKHVLAGHSIAIGQQQNESITTNVSMSVQNVQLRTPVLEQQLEEQTNQASCLPAHTLVMQVLRLPTPSDIVVKY